MSSIVTFRSSSFGDGVTTTPIVLRRFCLVGLCVLADNNVSLDSLTFSSVILGNVFYGEKKNCKNFGEKLQIHNF